MKALQVDQRILIFLFTSIGLITLPHITHIPMTISGLFYLLLGWRVLGIWKPDCLPGKYLIFLLTVGALFLLYSQHSGVLGRDAGSRLFITALGLKLLEIKTEKDLYLITFLAFIVASTQFLYTQSILMSVYIVFICCVLLATLVAINSDKPQTAAALKTSAIIILQALPIAIILFVLFPRVEAPRWMMFEDEHSARSGLSDSMEPGSISQLGMSDELVFRVRFEGEIPPPKDRYWRGPVFSYTDGKKWTQSRNLYFARYLDKPRFYGTAYRYTLMMEPQDKRWVFALDMPSAFPDTVKRNALYQLINTRSQEKRKEYKITSYPSYNTGYITKIEYRDSLQLPKQPSDKIRQLVDRLGGFKLAPEVFIRSVLNHFTTEDFHYTLMPPLMQENPIETFLFETHYGFCSHYAAAFVYLMRVAGIPARIVGGYQGGELNKAGNFLEIKQANAHAWAEVWLQKKGWTRVDPTAAIAPNRIEHDVNIDLQIATGQVNFSPINISSNQALSWLKQAKQLWGTVDYSWQRWVINYTGDSQTRLLSSWGIKNFKAMAYWLFISIATITLILSWFILKGKGAKTDKALMLYYQFCKKLEKAGITKLKGETALSFSHRVEQQYPNLADNISNITALFVRLRYEKNKKEEDLALLKAAITEFKTQGR